MILIREPCARPRIDLFRLLQDHLVVRHKDQMVVRHKAVFQQVY
jgi:hypothetical protein